MVLVVLPPVVVEEIVRDVALLAGKLCQVALLSLGLSSVTAQLEVPLVGLVFIVGIEYVELVLLLLLLLLLPALVPVLLVLLAPSVPPVLLVLSMLSAPFVLATRSVSSVASCIVRV